MPQAERAGTAEGHTTKCLVHREGKVEEDAFRASTIHFATPKRASLRSPPQNNIETAIPAIEANTLYGTTSGGARCSTARQGSRRPGLDVALEVLPKNLQRSREPTSPGSSGIFPLGTRESTLSGSEPPPAGSCRMGCRLVARGVYRPARHLEV